MGTWNLVGSPEISVKSRAKLPQCPSKGTNKYFVCLSMNVAFQCRVGILANNVIVGGI